MNRQNSLSGPGRNVIDPELLDPGDLVLGDLDPVDHEYAGQVVAQVDADVVHETGELTHLRA